MVSIDDLEKVSFNAWPAFQHLFVDGYLLRFADGYTKRANSVNRLSPTTIDPERLIPYCEAYYRSKQLPTIFRIVGRREMAGLDAVLSEHGYRQLEHSLVMTRPLTEVPDDKGRDIDLAQLTLDRWITSFALLSESEPSQHVTHRRILKQIVPSCLLVALYVGEQPVACGMGVLDRQWFGLFDLVTYPAFRGQGHGTALVQGMMQWARDRGATTAYLQVVQSNHGARRLYKRLGFQEAYSYWYRIGQAGPEA